MIVSDFYIEGVTAVPNKADPPLIVDPDTVLSGTLSFQFLKPV